MNKSITTTLARVLGAVVLLSLPIFASAITTDSSNTTQTGNLLIHYDDTVLPKSNNAGLSNANNIKPVQTAEGSICWVVYNSGGTAQVVCWPPL